MRGIFVTGTDTGVGKTTVSAGIIAALARRGRVIAPMKPIETGGGDDAERLVAATGRAWPLEHVRPYAFSLPASPEVAARREGVTLDKRRIFSSFEILAGRSELVWVEGAGGLLVPIANNWFMVDAASALKLPLLIVGRSALGTINHTLLTLEAARARGLTILGVVLSRGQEPEGPDEFSTPEIIARYGKIPILASVPYLTRTDPQIFDPLAEKIERALNLG